MKLDAHVHSNYSGMTTIWPLSLIMRESYNTTERVYALAKARGMDLVAITDHDTIAGALTLAHLPDVIVGCEVSASFPGQPVDVHLGVLDITERQFCQIDLLRGDVLELVQYLRDEAIFTTINHVASQVNGRLTPSHIAALLPWVDAFEVINGSRLGRQNRTAQALAASASKRSVGGSDSHTGRGIGRTWTEVAGASNRAEFMAGLRAYVPPLRALLKHATADRLDVIHLTTPGPMGLAAMHVASRLGLPMVGSFHTHLAEYTTRLSGSQWLGTLMQEYMRWPYGKCRQILAPSESTRQMLIESKIDPAKLRLWSRGVSTTRFDPARRSEGLRADWGVSQLRPAVLYVGRLSVEKGLREVAAIRRSLEARRIAHRFVFVGDGPMRHELERLVPDAVFTGTQTPDEVAVAMASSDLFVFPSRTDTAGNVVLEAQASGLPVLVTDEGGPRENMLDKRTGVVCASTRELCRQVLELCVRTPRRQQMGAQAREYALGRQWQTALAPLYQAYREVAAVPLSVPAMKAGVAAA